MVDKIAYKISFNQSSFIVYLIQDYAKLEEIAGKYNLQVRGTSGEHSESIGGIYDISNKRRLGLTEYQAVKEMSDGIAELIKIEKSL